MTQNSQILIATEQQAQRPASLNLRNDSPVNMNRKCRDLCCFILFVFYYAAVIGLGIYLKLWENWSRRTIMFDPFDHMRRRCGHEAEDYTDKLATDYSKLITQSSDFYHMCEVINKLYSQVFECEDFKNINQNESALELARKFSTQASQFSQSVKDYPAAIKINGTKHCIPEPVAEDGNHAYCNPPNDAEYVCDVDFTYWVKKINDLTHSA